MSKLPLADPLGFQSTSITENLKCTRRLWHTPAKNPTNSILRFVAKDICHLSSACSLLGVFNSLMHHINYESIRITFTASCRFSSFSELGFYHFYLILSLEFLFIQHTQINRKHLNWLIWRLILNQGSCFAKIAILYCSNSKIRVCCKYVKSNSKDCWTLVSKLWLMCDKFTN